MNDWSDYPILLAVAETGSLTAAGEQLGISQPTVGRRIKALETRFGVPLLGKEEGKLVPTEFGFKVLDHIRRMETEADAITRSSATLETSLSGPIIIAASEGMGDWWLPSVMRQFRKDYPEILIDIKLDFKEANLAQREADIALRWMGPIRLFCVPGPIQRKAIDYVDKKGLPETSEELLDHDGVAMDIGANPFWPTNHNGSILDRPRPKFTTNSLLAHQHAIMSGYGVGMLALCSVDRGDSLVRILPDVERVEELWLVAHEDLRKSARVRAAFDFLADALLKDHNHFRYGTDSVFPHPHIHMHEAPDVDKENLEHTPA